MAIDKFRQTDIVLDQANGFIFNDFGKVGDRHGREVTVQITNRGVVSDQRDLTLVLAWEHLEIKNRGLEPFEALDATQGLFKVTLPDNVLNEGNVLASIGVKKDGDYIFSRNFKIVIEKNAFRGESAIESDAWTLLWEALDSVDNITHDVTLQLQQFFDESTAKWEAFYEANREVLENIDPGGVLLSEIIKARGSHDDLNDQLELFRKRVNEGEDVPDLVGADSFDVDGGIKDYFVQPLADFKKTMDSTKFSIGFGTDFHYDTMSNYEFVRGSERSLNHLMNITSISNSLNVLILGGDLIDSDNNMPVSTSKKYMDDFATTAFGTTKCDTFALWGNHDDTSNRTNAKPADIITAKEMAQFLQWDAPLYGETRTPGKGYFYKDYDDAKIRVIGLNSSDVPETVDDNGVLKYKRFNTSAFSQTQIDWLINDALQLKDAMYHVIVFSHMPVIGMGVSLGDYYRNGRTVLEILKAFKAGTSGAFSEGTGDFALTSNFDFTAQGAANLIGYFYGHMHHDKAAKVDDVNVVGTTCSLMGGEASREEPRHSNGYGQPYEDAWDVLEVDVNTRRVSLKRFGWKSEVERLISY